MASYAAGVSDGIDMGVGNGETFIFAPSWDAEAVGNFAPSELAGDTFTSSLTFEVNASDNYSSSQGEGGSGNVVRSVPYLVRTTA